MGLAVVADEVRNLAQRSAQAAKDTAILSEESIAKSADGKTKVDQVASAIQAVTGDSPHFKTLVEEVNLGSQEQARAIDQISKAIVQMQNVTQTTAASAEESAAAAEEPTAQSRTLQEIAERLTIMVGGDMGAAAHNRFRHRPAPLANPGGASLLRREPASALVSLGMAVATRSQSAQLKEPVRAKAKFEHNALPLDDEF